MTISVRDIAQCSILVKKPRKNSNFNFYSIIRGNAKKTYMSDVSVRGRRLRDIHVFTYVPVVVSSPSRRAKPAPFCTELKNFSTVMCDSDTIRTRVQNKIKKVYWKATVERIFNLLGCKLYGFWHSVFRIPNSLSDISNFTVETIKAFYQSKDTWTHKMELRE